MSQHDRASISAAAWRPGLRSEKRRSLIGTIVTTLLICSAGCAAGNRFSYRAVEPQLSLRGSGTLAIGVHDQRSYIRSGDKHPDFVGLSRGGFYNPFDVTTEGGRPLAEDMSEVLSRALGRAGFRAQSVRLGQSLTSREVLDTLRQTGATRLLLLTLLEWKSDTGVFTTLIYDVRLDALDGDGRRLASTAIKGRDEFAEGAWNPIGEAKRAVPEAFRRIIEKLFEDATISNALR
jgi:hypothetical protein